jgi:membrane protease YdiL (CAAX protease family)
LQQHLQQRWQDARGALRAQGATTLAFGLAHAVVRGWALGLAVLLPAWLIGHLYRRHARLWPCVAVHALFNLTWLATAGILLPSA